MVSWMGNQGAKEQSITEGYQKTFGNWCIYSLSEFWWWFHRWIMCKKISKLTLNLNHLLFIYFTSIKLFRREKTHCSLYKPLTRTPEYLPFNCVWSQRARRRVLSQTNLVLSLCKLLVNITESFKYLRVTNYFQTLHSTSEYISIQMKC